MSNAYITRMAHTFECEGEHWALTVEEDNYIRIEETRKNGQEDTHMSLELFKNDKGRWEAEEPLGDWHPIVSYLGRAAVNKLVAYVNKHGVPDDPAARAIRRVNTIRNQLEYYFGDEDGPDPAAAYMVLCTIDKALKGSDDA